MQAATQEPSTVTSNLVAAGDVMAAGIDADSHFRPVDALRGG